MRQAWLGAILALLGVVGLGAALAVHRGWLSKAPVASDLPPPVLVVEVDEAAIVPPPAPPAEPPRASAASPAAAESEARAPESKVTPELEATGLSLEELMRVPGVPAPEGNDIDWAGERPETSSGKTSSRPRPRIDYSRENVTEGVPRQDERRRTDVGVSVPVDPNDRLRVKGGVRVDERDLSEAETESEATPTVGVEVRF